MPQPIRRPVSGPRSARRRFSRRLRRFPFAVRPSIPCRYGRSRFMQARKGASPMGAALMYASNRPVDPRSAAPRSRGATRRASGRGSEIGRRNFGKRDHLRPEADTFTAFYILLLHRWEAVPDGPRLGRRCFRRSAGTDRSPCTADARSLLRGFVRSTPDRFGNASGRRPPVSRHTAPPLPGGLRSHSMLTIQRVPNRLGTAPGARSGSRTAGLPSDRPPARDRLTTRRPLRRADCRPRSTALVLRAGRTCDVRIGPQCPRSTPTPHVCPKK